MFNPTGKSKSDSFIYLITKLGVKTTSLLREEIVKYQMHLNFLFNPTH